MKVRSEFEALPISGIERERFDPNKVISPVPLRSPTYGLAPGVLRDILGILDRLPFAPPTGGGTGTAVNTGDLITAAKMNLKMEDITDSEENAAFTTLRFMADSGGLPAGTVNYIGRDNTGDVTVNALTGKTFNVAVNGADVANFAAATLTLVQATLNVTAGGAVVLGTTDANTLAFKTGGTSRLRIANSLGSFTVFQTTANYTLTFSDPAAAVTLTFPAATGTLATLTGTETLTNKTLTLSGSPLNLTAGAGFVVGTTDNFALTLKTNNVNKVVINTALGSIQVNQTTGNYTLSFTDPGASRTLTIPDPGGADTFVFRADSATLTNKTLSASVMTGTFTGAHTYSGAITLTASPLNLTAGAAFTIGTTDAFTLIVKTGGSTRWTFAAASSNITAAGAADIIGQAATAAAIRITDGTNSYHSIDTRVATDNISAHTFSATGVSYASANGSTYSLVTLAAVTTTFTGGVQVTATNGVALNIAQPVLTSAAATTVVTASTVYIANAPSAAGAGPLSITNNYALHVAAGLTYLQGGLTLGTSPLNFTAGGAFVMGTTDAQTLAIKTNGTTRWTFASGSANLTAASAASIAGPAATAAALNLTDGTTSFIAIDTRVATDNVVAITHTGSAPTFASAAGSSYSVASVAAVTVTLTGGVQVTAMNGVALNLARPAINSAAATTVVTASTLYIANSPSAGGAGPVSITNNYALHVAAGISAFAGNVLITANTLNFTAGGAFTLGTTDANTIIVKTGGSTRWTFAAASSNITAAGAADIIGQANTASTLRMTDGTTAIVALDSRTGTDNVVVFTHTSVAPTFASAAGTTFRSVLVAAYTITLTGGTGVTAMDGMALYLDAPTVTSGAATTVTTASTMYIKPPVAAGAGPASFTNSRMINTSVAGCFLTAAGVWTDASSIEHKTSIRPVDWDEVLADIMQAHLVTYVRRDPSDGGFRRYGLVAEDAPDYLATADHKGVAAQYVAGAALAGVQALQQKLQDLTNELAKTNAKLAALGA